MPTKTLTAGPKIKTALPGPNAKRVLAGDDKYISPSYTRSYPLVAKSGRGIVVTDVDGNEFFDFSAGIAVTSTGHCHPEVVAAIQKQAAELIHMSGTDFYYESMITLAERLSKIAPMPGPHRIYYGNSGAEAVEARAEARALSHQAAERDCLLRRVPRTHHGRALADRVEAAAEAPFRAAGAGRDARALSRCVSRLLGRSAGRRGVRARLRALSSKRSCSRRCLPPEEVAAIFVEPVQGEGGYVVAPTPLHAGTATHLRSSTASCWWWTKCRAASVAPASGGRSSTPACSPTSSACAKGIASGMPLGVMMSRAEIMDWVPGSHASTFGGNPVCIAAALATLDVIEKEELLQNSAEVGGHMLKRMADWPKKHRSLSVTCAGAAS